MSRPRISVHFAASEFDCRDGQKWPAEAQRALEWWALVWGEPLRAAFGPVQVTSGFRHAAYNASVGGAPTSFHRYELRYGPTAAGRFGVGVAADVVPARGTPAAWQRWATRHGSQLRASGGVLAGVPVRGRLAAVAYPASGFIHLDTGPFRTWAG